MTVDVDRYLTWMVARRLLDPANGLLLFEVREESGTTGRLGFAAWAGDDVPPPLGSNPGARTLDREILANDLLAERYRERLRELLTGRLAEPLLKWAIAETGRDLGRIHGEETAEERAALLGELESRLRRRRDLFLVEGAHRP